MLLVLYTVKACFGCSSWVVLRLSTGGDGNCLDGETTAVRRVAGELSSTPKGFLDYRWISSTLSYCGVYCTITFKKTTKRKENNRIPGKLFGWGMDLLLNQTDFFFSKCIVFVETEKYINFKEKWQDKNSSWDVLMMEKKILLWKFKAKF